MFYIISYRTNEREEENNGATAETDTALSLVVKASLINIFKNLKTAYKRAMFFSTSLLFLLYAIISQRNLFERCSMFSSRGGTVKAGRRKAKRKKNTHTHTRRAVRVTQPCTCSLLSPLSNHSRSCDAIMGSLLNKQKWHRFTKTDLHISKRCHTLSIFTHAGFIKAFSKQLMGRS